MHREKLELKIKTLTPLHITDGALTELTPLEYVVDEKGLLHFLDLSTFVKVLTVKEREDFTAAAESDSIPTICRYIQELWQTFPERFKDAILWSTKAGDIAGLYKGLLEKPESRFFLKPFIRSTKRPYLPGSSLKGAFRTALIALFIGPDGIRKFMKSNSAILEAYVMNSRSKERRRKGWWCADAEKDSLKALKTSDVFFAEASTCIKNIINFKLVQEGKEDNFQSADIQNYTECIESEALAETVLVLEKRFFDFKKYRGRSFTLEEVIYACKHFYAKLIEYEQKYFFNTFSSKNQDSDIAGLYDRLLKINRQPDCFLLRVGRFCGRNSMSFNIYNQMGAEPASRHLVRYDNSYWPMGWAQVFFNKA